MRVLVTASKQDFYKLKDATALVREKLTDVAEVTSGEDVPWEAILETNGSWDEVYNWALRAFSGLILLETDEGGLGRGTYEMAKRFIAADQSVGVVRAGKIVKVKEVRVFDKNNWITNYGVVVT